jgi:hypothetical protein
MINKMTKKKNPVKPTKLEKQHRNLFPNSISEEHWSKVSSLEQPSLLEIVDSVSMPSSHIDPSYIDPSYIKPI